jgi:hypothetical protein
MNHSITVRDVLFCLSALFIVRLLFVAITEVWIRLSVRRALKKGKTNGLKRREDAAGRTGKGTL